MQVFYDSISSSSNIVDSRFLLWSVCIVSFRLHYVVILFYFLFASFSGGQLDECYAFSGNLPRIV